MEQAGNQLINTIISRQKLLETDVSVLKREQCAHSNQIETLAIEVHEMREVFNGKFDEIQKEMRWNFRQLRQDRDQLAHKVNLILEALAIKT